MTILAAVLSLALLVYGVRRARRKMADPQPDYRHIQSMVAAQHESFLKGLGFTVYNYDHECHVPANKVGSKGLIVVDPLCLPVAEQLTPLDILRALQYPEEDTHLAMYRLDQGWNHAAQLED